MAKRKSKQPQDLSKKDTVFEVTSPEEWREGSIHEVVLPSGAQMKLKRVGLLDLISQGAIPEHLSAITELSINEKEPSNLDMKQFAEYSELLSLVLRACAVDPKIIKEPEEGGMVDADKRDYLYDVEVASSDKVQVFQWSNGVLSQITPFRTGQQVRAASPSQRR